MNKEQFLAECEVILSNLTSGDEEVERLGRLMLAGQEPVFAEHFHDDTECVAMMQQLWRAEKATYNGVEA